MIKPTGALFFRAVATVAVVSISLSSSAQDSSLRLPPNPDAMRTRGLALMAANDLLSQARAAMRLGLFEKAAGLAEEAVGDLTALGGPNYATQAHEVLAELALLQGHPLETLRQAGTISPYLVDQRFAMTKALALIALGRTAEARAIVLKEIGTSEQPAYFRQAHHVQHFPVDSDRSDQALKASVYMIRATWWRNSPQYPETMADFRSALLLAPSEPALRLEFAESLVDLGAYEEAKAELAKVALGNDPQLKRGHDRVKAALARRIEHDPDRLKTRTATPPTSTAKPDKP